MKNALVFVVVVAAWVAQAQEPFGLRPPSWRLKVLDLGTAWVGTELQRDLRPEVKAEIPSVNFASEKGPSWIQITNRGMLTGKPTDRDRGVQRFEIRASIGTQFALTRAVVNVRRVEEFTPQLEGILELPAEAPGLAKTELPKGESLSDFAKSISELMNHPVVLSAEAEKRDVKITIDAEEDCTNQDLILAFHSALRANGLVAKENGSEISIEVLEEVPQLKDVVTRVRNMSVEIRRLISKDASASSYAWMVEYLEKEFGPLRGTPNGRLLVQYPTLIFSDTKEHVSAFAEFVQKRREEAGRKYPVPKLRFPTNPPGSPDPKKLEPYRPPE